MKPSNPANSASGRAVAERGFAALFGAFLGLTLLKFGNVAIFESLVPWPENGWEWALNPWPVRVGYYLLGIFAVAGLWLGNWTIRGPKWLWCLPLLWFGWQLVSATNTLDPSLTKATLKHFGACVVCFYVGYFVVGRTDHAPAFLGGLVSAMALVIATGFEQHFGGLERTRTYFYTYFYDQIKSMPPEYLKKISSNRIWGTLFYPNSLASALILLLPMTLALVLKHFTRLTLGARQFVAAVFLAGGLACLYWSGSKGGWLLMLLIGLVALLQAPVAKRLKLVLVGLVLVAGLAGFGLKYAGFFQRGATSVSARLDYWEAALRTALANPVFGTGPGTFAIPYAKIKRPESEMARLVHNDYLQQASDSGWLGWAALTVFAVGMLVATRPQPGLVRQTSLESAVWLGLAGWWLHGLMEFGLYMPALAWTAFAFSGWLLARRAKRVDKATAHR